MKIITGKVVDGRVELPAGEVPEGASVAVVTFDDDSQVGLSADDERELLDRLDAISRGEFLDGDDFLEQLRSRHEA